MINQARDPAGLVESLGELEANGGTMRSLLETMEALKAPLPAGYVAYRQQGGQQIPYLPWWRVAELLDHHCPGWEWSVTSIQTCGQYLVLTGRITLRTADGSISREATGCELLDCGSYGDPVSNAEAMAFRRAAAKFGLGRSLYDKATRSASARPVQGYPSPTRS